MGYSERYCHICGVSFNISRIRTKNEPRSHAWRECRSGAYTPFINGGRNSHIGECGRDAGCMLAFREDMAEELGKRQREYDEFNREQKHGTEELQKGNQDGTDADDDDDDENDESFVPDHMIMEKLRVDEQLNRSQNVSTEQSVMELAPSVFTMAGHATTDDTSIAYVEFDVDQDIEPMNYEYDNPPETCSEYEDELEEACMSLTSHSEAEAETRYHDFVDSLKHKGQAVIVQDGKELMLPLFRPLDGRDEDVVSTHGSDASFNCDEEEKTHQWRAKKLDHWISGKLSHYNHALSRNHPRHHRDDLWEHIAGPSCLNLKGYHGTRISKQEMYFANTLQCLVQKAHANLQAGEYGDLVSVAPEWQPEPDDEPWEQGASWFLSGISDYMPSRDCSDPRVFPYRHGRQTVNAENVCWSSDSDDPRDRYAMPFHPSCFEIYKRASIERHGVFDVDVLGSWWQLKSRYDEFHSFPRSEAVKRGEEQWWQHNPGDEHLVADPLWPPGLAGAIVAAKLGPAWAKTDQSASRWTSLPLEITTHILGYLDMVSVAKASLAIPETRSLAKQVMQRRLQTQYPHLWELTSTQPYYKWVGITADDLKTRQKEIAQHEIEIQWMYKVLEEEGYNDMLDQVKQYWAADHEVKKRDLFDAMVSANIPLQVPTDEVGIAKFVIALHEASENDDLKGLQNRERIWKDCETILDQIEELQRQGEVLPNGQPRPGAQLSEH